MDKTYNPIATYRVQFHKEFTFRDFREIIPYLVQVGVRTIYASPIFEAVPGSQHGYDGTDPNRINPEIGTEEELMEIAETLKQNNMSWLQDIVPNHLAYHENNKWLMDVLEKGRSSTYASYFDINWNHPEFDGKLMVPFPGGELEKILIEKFPAQHHYQLCPWQDTDHRINYRRFFLVNSLICTNIHDNNVFNDFHQLIGRLCAKKVFRGVRVDHVDGLYDPTKYLNDLRNLAGEECFIVVEKILEPQEDMPRHWPIQGNSGYDFLGIINNLFTNKEAEFALTAHYYDITGDSTTLHQQIREKKSAILHNHMRGELDNLVRLYKETFEDEKIDEEELKSEIATYMTNCPVYRYYDDDYPVMERDKNRDREGTKTFYARCMQFTGPLMAKGVEDTLMYTYNRFIGHNEVGDSPEFFGYTVNTFHELMTFRLKDWPHSMNASSTHDTKRGEDVRARLNVLTDLYEEWIALANKWRQENDSLKTNGWPDANDEYLIYQTLAGSYPLEEADILSYPERIAGYLRKALREAKVHSNWTSPNEDYERAAIQFAHALIATNSSFLHSFQPFLDKIADYGMINSFGQLILKFTCPGVPDIYQGTELWDLSLVDPDNRRPVDYSIRMKMIGEHKSMQDLWSTRRNGQVKLWLLRCLNIIRNRYIDVFANGEYIPLTVSGQFKNRVIGFIRKNRYTSILVLIPLNFATVHEYSGSHDVPVADWKDTKVLVPGQPADWENLLNEGHVKIERELSLNEAFKTFPALILKS